MIKLDNVPIKIRNQKKIYDWKNSIGCTITVIDEDSDKQVNVKIIEYNRDKRTIYVIYDGNKIPIHTGHIETCRGGKVLGKYTGDFKEPVLQLNRGRRGLR